MKNRKRISSRRPEGLRQVFVFVTGTSPAVVTETLWWFANRMKPAIVANEAHMITTTVGADFARRRLMGDEGQIARLADAYGIDRPETHLHLLKSTKKRSMGDIRSDEENRIAGDQIFKIVSRLTADPATVCHFSIAGGRKTLSFHLSNAAMFFAREKDTLSHVLATPSIEANPEAFFPLPGARRTGIDLAFLPLLRLRDHSDSGHSLDEIVWKFQNRLDSGKALPRVTVDFSARKIIVGDTAIILPHQQIALWSLYAFGPNEGLAMEKVLDRGEAFFSYLAQTGTVLGGTELENLWHAYLAGDGMAREELENRLLQLRSKLSRRIRRELQDVHLDKLINIHPVSNGVRPRRYGVKLRRTDIGIKE